MKNLKDNQKGFSLLEITVSLSIFSLIMVMATGIFQSVARGQQSAIASQNTQESLRYVFEVVSKETRNAQKGTVSNVAPDSHVCIRDASDTDNRIFNKNTIGDFGATSDIFYFTNKDGHCVYYYLINETLMVRRDDMLSNSDSAYISAATPKSIEVTEFNVSIRDNEFDEMYDDWIQPYVTIQISAKAKGKEFLDNEIKMQTTISSRVYE